MGSAPDLLPVEPGYKNVLRARLAFLWLGLATAATIAGLALDEVTRLALLLPVAALLAGLLSIAIAPARIYRRLRYGLSERLLQVVRGWLFHTDTIVPFVRVQHIDVMRGPFDKWFGTATLVVHTAGTHNSVVMLPGLSPERAAEIREAIRHEIRADAE